jgi:excisionase family DNA binding protein
MPRGTPKDDGDVLNAEQAAELLGLSVITVRRLAAAGEIPGRKAGKEWRFLRAALLDWLADGAS